MIPLHLLDRRACEHSTRLCYTGKYVGVKYGGKVIYASAAKYNVDEVSVMIKDGEHGIARVYFFLRDRCIAWYDRWSRILDEQSMLRELERSDNTRLCHIDEYSDDTFQYEPPLDQNDLEWWVSHA